MPDAKAKKKAQSKIYRTRLGGLAKQKAYQAEWYTRPGMASRKRGFKLKHLYGITLDDYDCMLVEQNFCCAICDRHRNELPRALSVDHNHVTGAVRGLLCSACNTALGKFNSDKDSTMLRRAADYIDNNNLKGN